MAKSKKKSPKRVSAKPAQRRPRPKADTTKPLYYFGSLKTENFGKALVYAGCTGGGCGSCGY